MPHKVRRHRKSSQRKVSRKKPVWRITAEYPFGLYSDEEIERLAGKASSGAGAGFGKRDMDWHFGSGPAAERAAKKLARKRKVHVELEKYGDKDDLDPIDSYVVK